jgi:hypothetical protein
MIGTYHHLPLLLVKIWSLEFFVQAGLKPLFSLQHWWLMSVVLVTQEAEIRRIVV